MKRAPSSLQLLLPLALCVAGGGAACESRAPSEDALPKTAPALASARPRPIPPVHMPGALPQDETASEAAAARAPIKHRGKPGERLEGDVFYFKVLSTRACDEAGRVLGVEVELEAKDRLNVSPRDVVLGSGGVTFNANLDFQRKADGCEPRLVPSSLRKGQKARGFALFDLPSKPPERLGIIYQPTRWGGAGHVVVDFEQPLAKR